MVGRMHAQVQCLDVVEDVHVPPAFSRFSISSISRSSVRARFSFMVSSLRFRLGPQGTDNPAWAKATQATTASQPRAKSVVMFA